MGRHWFSEWHKERTSSLARRLCHIPCLNVNAIVYAPMLCDAKKSLDDHHVMFSPAQPLQIGKIDSKHPIQRSSFCLAKYSTVSNR